jgi:hypothetical protein
MRIVNRQFRSASSGEKSALASALGMTLSCGPAGWRCARFRRIKRNKTFRHGSAHAVPPLPLRTFSST